MTAAGVGAGTCSPVSNSRTTRNPTSVQSESPQRLLGDCGSVTIQRSWRVKSRAADRRSAASLLYDPDPDRFQRLVEKSFGAEVPEEQVLRGPVSYLPLICQGPAITTNFDRVLESAFG